MRIEKEYMLRHGLKVDITQKIPTDRGGCLFFKFEEGNQVRWLIHYLYWNHEPKYHPGKYFLELHQPCHDLKRTKFKSASPQKTFEKIAVDLDGSERKKVFWDEYDDHMIQLAASEEAKHVVHGDVAVFLAAWEMFLQCYDARLANSNFYHLVYPTIDPNRTLVERQESAKDMISALSRLDDTNLGRIWLHEFESKYVSTYLHTWATSVANQ